MEPPRHVPRVPPHDQAKRQEVARRAEQLVADLLCRDGFDIVAMNLRVGYLELDIVARKEQLVVVVEVRTRAAASWTTGFGSITKEKRRRVRRAANRLWRMRYRNDPTVSRLRIDAAAVIFTEQEARIHYCPGAF